MSLIVEFSLTSPRMVLYDAMTSAPDLTVDVESVDTVPDENPVSTVWATGGDLAAFDRAIHEDSTVGEVVRLESLPERNLYRYQVADDAEVMMYPRWVEVGGAQLHVEASDGEWFQRIRFPGRGALREFQSLCARQDVAFTLHRMYDEPRGDESRSLTAAQREAIEIGLNAGYFEVPRKATLAAVADELGISEQATSERLRRAMRHLAVDAVEN